MEQTTTQVTGMNWVEAVVKQQVKLDSYSYSRQVKDEGGHVIKGEYARVDADEVAKGDAITFFNGSSRETFDTVSAYLATRGLKVRMFMYGSGKTLPVCDKTTGEVVGCLGFITAG